MSDDIITIRIPAKKLDSLMAEYANEGNRIYLSRTAGDKTWLGLLASFVMDVRHNSVEKPVIEILPGPKGFIDFHTEHGAWDKENQRYEDGCKSDSKGNVIISR